MLFLLFAILHIALFIYFVLICFRATKLLRERFGLFTAVVFILGLLSFISNSGDNKASNAPNPNQFKTWKFASEDSLDSNLAFCYVELNETLISKYVLSIQYGSDKQDQRNTPLSATSWTNGFVAGTVWEPSSIMVNRTRDNNRFEYYVEGLLKWKLLGMNLYMQRKAYKGLASIH